MAGPPLRTHSRNTLRRTSGAGNGEHANFEHNQIRGVKSGSSHPEEIREGAPDLESAQAVGDRSPRNLVGQEMVS